MRPRYLGPSLRDLAFGDHKIALVSGPRQCGKTTLAKMLLADREVGAYHNWDDPELRRVWTRSPRALLLERSRAVPFLVFDEIHKARGWKRTLKALYDTRETPHDIMVTGSARLNVYRRGGDSLLGRALHFRLHPFSLGEVCAGASPPSPDEAFGGLLGGGPRSPAERDGLDAMLALGCFPEPLFGASERKARLWRRSRVEKLVREDLRDLTRALELSRVETLASLLPERVGSLFSRASLQRDLEVSHDTITRWVSLLQELYYLFEVKPWTRSVVRTLKKEGKVFLWDHAEVTEPGPRFENLVACHLLKACHFWTDTGFGDFDLHFLRNKEGEEIDFLVTRGRKPWLAVEAKLSEERPSPAFGKFLRYLGLDTGVQIVARAGVARWHRVGDARVLVTSASALAWWP
jgi:predicted AAA+ superfamily ATPase